jgi:hypothetical protein
MTRERDLFRAIVVSAVALVGPVACSDGDPAPVDSGASRIDASGDDGGRIADADRPDSTAPSDGGEPDDAGELEDSGMVLIL